jgi:hypothetical protein
VGTPAFFPPHHLIEQLWATQGTGLRPQSPAVVRQEALNIQHLGTWCAIPNARS